MAKVDYLIKFDDDGNRGETHDAVFWGDEKIKEYLSKGFVAVSPADYNNLLGNNSENQIYIRTKDGKYIPKPPYVPTADEVQASKLAAVDAEYAGKLEENKSAIIVAATVDQDESYADELRTERRALQDEYIEKRSEI